MNKTAFMAFIMFLTMTAISAKIVRRTLSIFQSNVPDTETLAIGSMEFVYDFYWCNDTTDWLDDNFTKDRMLLQIGKDGMSKFSSYKNLTVDSLLMNMTQDQVVDAAIEGKLSNGEFMTIFKNYPDGKLTHTEKICMDWFMYEEEMPVLDWQLTDSVADILGYECLSAECEFRGRKWEVFYCEDIPIMDGPWKLQGLPGLIMKATDENGHYNFECVGINSDSRRPITIYKVPFINTDRRKYYDTKHRYDVNPYAYYEAGEGGHVDVPDEDGSPLVGAYDPIELSYDYIERDCR